ncbi:unnamed protein product [Orchesella dallaii]|uniref:Pyrroline-5-carboxylate reductase n=1 Tax=Orchesella dallaii TaxID=48710 RepID=A0ABP1Q2M3_9HEXA
MLGLNLGFIGAGQMARAIGISLIQKGLVKPSQVIVSSPEASHLDVWKGHGCNATFHNVEVLQSSQLIVWAVKPQYFQAALQDTMAKMNGPQDPVQDKFHVSIMAGVPLDKFSNLLHSHLKISPVRSARVMPNIAMRVSTGVSVYTMGKEAQKSDHTNLNALLSSLGLTYQVAESQINAYCGLFASGIGFMFPILEAMADGGVKMGIPRDLSLQISAQTMKGAAELLLNNDAADPSLNHPGQLKDSVCSPGGTTIEGVAELEEHGVRNAFIKAIQAATLKGDLLDKNSK